MKNKKRVEATLRGIREVIEGGTEEKKEVRKPIIDKTTLQVSIKIPQNIALRAGINQSSDPNFALVVNPKTEETLKEISEAKFLIYLISNKK